MLGGKQRPDPESVRERDRDVKVGMAGMQMPEEDTPRDKTELLEELSESDLLDEINDPALRNLATKDIPTSNFDDGQVAEFSAYVDVALLKKRARHPHEGQDVTGVLREWVHDDPHAGLDPIDKGDLLSDETFARAIKARVLKGKNAGLMRTVLSSIRHSVVERKGGDDDSGGRILSRLRG
jgi:hypothetical protein